MAKYTIMYCSGPTGYGWERTTDDIAKVDDAVKYYGSEYTALLHIWDDGIKQFVYWKDAYERKPRIDMIHAIDRDFRTTTRTRKTGH